MRRRRCRKIRNAIIQSHRANFAGILNGLHTLCGVYDESDLIIFQHINNIWPALINFINYITGNTRHAEPSGGTASGTRCKASSPERASPHPTRPSRPSASPPPCARRSASSAGRLRRRRRGRARPRCASGRAARTAPRRGACAARAVAPAPAPPPSALGSSWLAEQRVETAALVASERAPPPASRADAAGS